MRRPSPVSEDAILALEAKAEGVGNGVAGVPAATVPESLKPEIPVPSVEIHEGPERGIVQRTGRLRGDGSRTKARKRRRMTVYLEPETAKALEMRSVASGKTNSDLVETALLGFLRT